MLPKSSKGFTGLEILAVVFVVSLIGGGTVVVSDDAKPGDFLYGVDLAVESFQESVTTDPVRKLELKLQHAEERAGELKALENELANEALTEDDMAQLETLVEDASDLTVQAFVEAEETVVILAETLGEDEAMQVSEKLEGVAQLLEDLQIGKEDAVETVTRVKVEMEDAEFESEVEVLSDEGTTQVVKVEEEVDEETGEVERRVKVYEVDEFGEEIKILDIREKDGVTEVKSDGPDEDDEDDDESPDFFPVETDDDSDSPSDESAPDSTPSASPTIEIDEDDDDDLTPSPTISDLASPSPTDVPDEEDEEDEESSSDATSSSEYRVEWDDGVFEPSTITISVGDLIEFKNKDDDSIRVASNPHPTHTDLPDLDSGSLGDGDEYTYTFTQVGTWTVHNHNDPSKTVTIIVQ